MRSVAIYCDTKRVPNRTYLGISSPNNTLGAGFSGIVHKGLIVEGKGIDDAVIIPTAHKTSRLEEDMEEEFSHIDPTDSKHIIPIWGLSEDKQFLAMTRMPLGSNLDDIFKKLAFGNLSKEEKQKIFLRIHVELYRAVSYTMQNESIVISDPAWVNSFLVGGRIFIGDYEEMGTLDDCTKKKLHMLGAQNLLLHLEELARIFPDIQKDCKFLSRDRIGNQQQIWRDCVSKEVEDFVVAKLREFDPSIGKNPETCPTILDVGDFLQSLANQIEEKFLSGTNAISLVDVHNMLQLPEMLPEYALNSETANKTGLKLVTADKEGIKGILTTSGILELQNVRTIACQASQAEDNPAVTLARRQYDILYSRRNEK